jgi:hypothetical protein
MCFIETKYCKGKPPGFGLEIKWPEELFVCGGSVRRYFTGEPQTSDVDMFCVRQIKKEEAEKLLKGLGAQNISSNANAVTGYIKGRPFQIILPVFGHEEALFDKFDFWHCCWSWNPEMESLVTTPVTIMCTERKHLSLKSFQQGFELDTLRRAFKYQRQGYTPCNGTLLDLGKMLQSVPQEEKANPFKDLSPGPPMNPLERQAVMSPGGGHRILRFD